MRSSAARGFKTTPTAEPLEEDNLSVFVDVDPTTIPVYLDDEHASDGDGETVAPPAVAPDEDADTFAFAKRSLNELFDDIHKRFKTEHAEELQREKARGTKLQDQETVRCMEVLERNFEGLPDACIEAFNAGGKASVKAVCAAIFARTKQQMKNVE
jgi:hypothetical protein